MATILPFQRYAFGPAEVDALQAALADHCFPGGWRGWNGALSNTGECEELEVVNPNDWEPLTLLRTHTGHYLARDADGIEVARAETFRELLSALEITPS
ncbi:hypothetical protein [Salinisphaera sp. Q1T1-3]|uniref:hypothetical protein n=1 Tax=Salinisphaera sp. Q1T1-3 TaxID=2321229 RepID=UPI000E716A14|nr:hypothetical protein [Salinisphaera sp. Q1T1-3]RJS93809.1 hypothetical protein D3260_07050 [Salinisphaera sp. Q1T1-3]